MVFVSIYVLPSSAKVWVGCSEDNGYEKYLIAVIITERDFCEMFFR